MAEAHTRSVVRGEMRDRDVPGREHFTAESLRYAAVLTLVVSRRPISPPQ